MPTKTIAFCLAAAVWLFTFSSCRRQNNFFQQEVICLHNNMPVTGPSVLYSAGLQQVSYDSAICGFMPMHKDAYWIYTDSFFNSDGSLSLVSQDTLRITGIFKSPLSPSLFWRMASRNRKGMNGLFYTTDSLLYSLQAAFAVPTYFQADTWAGYRAAGYPMPHPPATGPRNTDTLFTMNAVSDMAYMEKTFPYHETVNVPAGSYSDCIGFHKFLNITSEQMIFKPGVGMVKYISYYSNFSSMFSYGSVKQVSVLTSYHLF